MDTLFSNITAVTMADRLPVILGAYVGVTGGKISYISQKPPEIVGVGSSSPPGKEKYLFVCT